MPIAFARAFDMSCYIGGIGGLGYLMHTREISDRFLSPLPPTPFWYVDDWYFSIQLFCSAFQIEKLRSKYAQDTKMEMLTTTRKPGSVEEYSKSILTLIESKLSKGEIQKGPELERDKQLLSNIATSSQTKSCLIDSTINVGIRSTYSQWLEFLEKDGRLHTAVELKAAFEEKAVN